MNDDDDQTLDNFTGVVRLFPLPNVVLFPQVIQPLHIFEPRYRQMTADALAGDQLIAPALLQAGWEADYEGRPAIHPVVCIGRIVGDQRLSDGRYNILLRGVSRARLVAEAVTETLYRSAQVELLAEGPAPDADVCQRLHQQLGQVVRGWFPPKGPALQQLLKLLKSELPLGALCDILSFAVPLAIDAKQELLEEVNVEQRALLLLHHLSSREPPKPAATDGRDFPPGFSPN